MPPGKKKKKERKRSEFVPYPRHQSVRTKEEETRHLAKVGCRAACWNCGESVVVQIVICHFTLEFLFKLQNIKTLIISLTAASMDHVSLNQMSPSLQNRHVCLKLLTSFWWRAVAPRIKPQNGDALKSPWVTTSSSSPEESPARMSVTSVSTGAPRAHSSRAVSSVSVDRNLASVQRGRAWVTEWMKKGRQGGSVNHRLHSTHWGLRPWCTADEVLLMPTTLTARRCCLVWDISGHFIFFRQEGVSQYFPLSLGSSIRFSEQQIQVHAGISISFIAF